MNNYTKIAHIIVGLDIGGAETALKRLITTNSLSKRYIHCVISLTDIGKIGEELKNDGIDVYALGMKSNKDLIHGWLSLIALLRSIKVDIVQTWMYHSSLLGGLAAKYIGNKRIIWCIRATEVNADISVMTILVRYICSLLSLFIPTRIIYAAESSKLVHTNLGYDKSKSVVIPNGFDINIFTLKYSERNRIRQSFNIKNDDIFIGSVGRFSPDKDHLNYITAASLLSKKYRNIKFIIIGRGLDYKNKLLVEWINNSGITSNIYLVGEKYNIVNYLSSLDIYCLHSRTEAFPNSLGEAMAIGLPCVSTDVGDSSKLLGGCGVVVPKNDPIALAAGIEKLLKLSNIDREIIGQKARKRINEEYDLTLVREKYELIYNEIMSREIE